MSDAATGAIGPIRLAIDVACPVEHAFAAWTARMDAWWPTDHTTTRVEIEHRGW